MIIFFSTFFFGERIFQLGKMNGAVDFHGVEADVDKVVGVSAR